MACAGWRRRFFPLPTQEVRYETRRGMFFLLRLGAGLPGPAAVDFHLEGETQEGSDQDDRTEDGEVFQSGGHGDGADDVAGDEEFESEQDGAAEALAIGAVAVESGGRAGGEGFEGGEQDAEYDDEDSGGVDGHAEGFDGGLESGHGLDFRAGDFSSMWNFRRMCWSMGVSKMPLAVTKARPEKRA
jgi:hypothetical protein